MWTLVIWIFFLDSSVPYDPNTTLERESRRFTFESREACEEERLSRWIRVYETDKPPGNVALELPEAEGDSRWTFSGAYCEQAPLIG